MPRKKMEADEYRYTARQVGESVDPVTGEVRPILALHEPIGPKQTGRPKNTRVRVTKGRTRRVTKNFVYVDTESMAMLRLTMIQHRVLMFLMSKIDQGTNEIRVSGVYIAKSLGMSPSVVSKTMKTLRERLIIVPIEYGVWRINSNIAWTGEYKKWYSAATEDDEPYWTQEEYEAAQEGPVLAVVE